MKRTYIAPRDTTREVFHTQQFRAFCLGQLRAVQGAQSTTPDSAGGFLVGGAGQSVMDFHLGESSVMRAACEPRRVTSGEPIPYAAQSSAAVANAASTAENADVADAAEITFRGGTLKYDTWVTKPLVLSRALLEDSATDLEREIVQVLAGWMAPPLNASYTSGAGSTIIQGLSEGTALKDWAATSLAAADPLVALHSLMNALPRHERQGAEFMASTQSILELLRGLAKVYPGAFPSGAIGDERRIRLGIKSAWMNDDVQPDITASAAGAITAMPAKSLFYGNLAAAYRIYDVGEPVILRHEDSPEAKKRQVSFTLVLRTAGRLIGPDRSVIYGS